LACSSSGELRRTDRKRGYTYGFGLPADGGLRSPRWGISAGPESADIDTARACDTVCHMTAITIRELHAATGKWVRQAARSGGVHVTERGRVVAKLVPASADPVVPYFARRKLTPAFRRQARFLVGGTDSTALISAERDRAVS
jgi:antitoxin (DNA-binding transcriptional repressor) of toxin-antitoxin stability system